MPHPMKQIPPLRPDYSAAGIAAYVAELEWENRKLKEELEEMRNKSVNVDKFYPILRSSDGGPVAGCERTNCPRLH